MQVQQPIQGFFFALIAVSMWGALPIALKQVLVAMDAETILWYRVFLAATGLLIFFALKKRKQQTLKKIPALSRRQALLLLMGVLGLSANFFFYNLALQYIPPTTSQVLSPLSSFAMMLAGVFLFKERIGVHQKIGLLLLIIGLILFFNDRLQDFLQFSLYMRGVAFACFASMVWLAYGIAQKLLLARFQSQQILCMIYCGCALLFLPMAKQQQIWQLSGFQLGCLLFCCANTLVAYGCYAEALNRWEVAKVSAIMTQIPVFTIIFSELLMLLDPQDFHGAQLNLISYLGAGIVVAGALLSAIGHKFLKPR